MKRFSLFFLALLPMACYQPTRECQNFRTGSFRFTAEVEGEEQTTLFTRGEDLEVSEYAGKTDSAGVRWINDCEYILSNLNPRTRAEEKPVHVKILSTTENSYTFEYKLVGTSRTSRGTAIKTD
ncbi:DNA topoisomerase IV [Robiginitalea sp. SC105]|uniref:DNA topoisomerase IV n=1 Tax=Robiginitalea sp. SC105 TaxID=2762332 RepID=UPI00163AD018|nr:DNA topoisomerase IV [Robiginitalea sp. SC105]MBC2840630.1 DNA topoisomerase IV [Robiginitalea sp. SC105]